MITNKSNKTNPLAVHVPAGTIVEGRFSIETLSTGKYSTVFKVEDILDCRQRYCLKIQPESLSNLVVDDMTRLFESNANQLQVEYDRASKINYLHQEIAVLNKLATRSHMARLFYCERCDPFSLMLTTLFGQSIWDLRQSLPTKHLSAACSTRIGVHTLFQLKQIHEIGYILRDLKIGDILVGLSGREKKMVFIVDFGMCRTYVMKGPDNNLIVRPPREKAYIRGILRYCSPRVHERLDISRRDDLWSLMYILIELTVGLPWRDMRIEKHVANKKHQTPDLVLLRNCPPEWLKIMEHIRELSFASRPDYKLIFDCLQESLFRMKASYSDPWDWDLAEKDAIIEADVSERTDTSKEQIKNSPTNERQEISTSSVQNEVCEISPPKQKFAFTAESKDPFGQIINALRKSADKCTAMNMTQQTACSPHAKRRRMLVDEYDPLFPTTNPEEFSKNDIGF